MQDCFIACVDGLSGFASAIEAVFPQTQVQLCVVHKVRASLKYVAWKERKAVAADLRKIYAAATLGEAEAAAARLRRGVGCQVPRDRARLARRLDAPHRLL